jgi:hypothetical protein
MIHMKKPKREGIVIEIKCPACEGASAPSRDLPAAARNLAFNFGVVIDRVQIGIMLPPHQKQRSPLTAGLKGFFTLIHG